MTGRSGAGPQGYDRHDWYADWRCVCGHLLYANQEPGDPCQFCSCTDHRSAERGGRPS